MCKVNRPMRTAGTRFLAITLSLLFVLTAFAGNAAAAQKPSVTISSGEVIAGEDVTLLVSIQDNPGIAAAMLYIYYDTDVFEVSMDGGMSTQGKFRETGGLLTNTIEIAKQNGRYDGAAGKDGIIALWYNGRGENVSENGAFLKIKLRAKPGAANGVHTVQMGVAPDSCCNEKGESIKLSTGSATVTVTGGDGTKQPQTPTEPPTFTDTNESWARDEIEDAAELGLIKGHLGKYRPDDTMTRAEFVTILHRAMGEPKPSQADSFNDLTQDWYRDAIAWAEENGVVDGVGNGRFAPNGSVTREQLVTILYRLAGKPEGMELLLTGVYDSQYPDSGQIGTWAKNALYWSIYKGIYCGVSSGQIGTTLAPKAAATRAQIAVMITRYLDNLD